MSVLKEVQRKVFHMLSLVFLAAYLLIGYPRVMPWMYAFSALVAAVELGRLYVPALNQALVAMPLFSSISRPEEHRRVSGLFHTTFGVLLLWLFFGAHRQIVAASIYCVAFGDTAAALIGKSLGRVRLPGSKKSLEGSAACWTACFLSCKLTGFGSGAAAAAALCATVVEFCPTTTWFNDNLWLPVAAAVALKALG